MHEECTARVQSAKEIVVPLPERANETGMPFRSRVGILLYQRNRERAEAGQPLISLNAVAKATGIAYSALRALARNETGRIDFDTLDRLWTYFGVQSLDEILEHIPEPEREQ